MRVSGHLLLRGVRILVLLLIPPPPPRLLIPPPRCFRYRAGPCHRVRDWGEQLQRLRVHVRRGPEPDQQLRGRPDRLRVRIPVAPAIALAFLALGGGTDTSYVTVAVAPTMPAAANSATWTTPHGILSSPNSAPSAIAAAPGMPISAWRVRRRYSRDALLVMNGPPAAQLGREQIRVVRQPRAAVQEQKGGPMSELRPGDRTGGSVDREGSLGHLMVIPNTG
jgi:hypothetical protein